MQCTKCNTKGCRSLEACTATKFEGAEIVEAYFKGTNPEIVEAAAKLVDDGRAGTLSRMQELTEFAKEMGYKKLGLAYCWGMEAEAAVVSQLIRNQGLQVAAVSCTVGGMAQETLNLKSDRKAVACNPIGQAVQLNQEHIDLAVMMGLCMGHDIIFQQNVQAPATTLVVKDRTNGHRPLEGIMKA